MQHPHVAAVLSTGELHTVPTPILHVRLVASTKGARFLSWPNRRGLQRDIQMTDILDRLARTVTEKRAADPKSSWTAQLLAAGPEKAARKFGEEAVEAVIEAVRGDRERLAAEAADVLYHLIVMLAARGIELEEVLKVLEEREGISGVDEKAARRN